MWMGSIEHVDQDDLSPGPVYTFTNAEPRPSQERKINMDKHCKGCTKHYSATARRPATPKNASNNDWCFGHGSWASKAIGHCKNTGMKTIKAVDNAK